MKRLGSLYAVKLARLAVMEDAWSCGHPSAELLAKIQQLRAEVLALSGDK